MLHRVSRVIGVWLLLVAMIALVVDGTKSLGNGGRIVVTPLAAQWQSLSPSSYQAARKAVDGALGAGVWSHSLVPVLDLPTWAIFGLLGLLFYWLGQKRRRIEVFIN
jgi:hypothetical protein